MNKVVYVKACFKPKRVVKTVKVPTGEKKKGMFGGEKEVMRKEQQLVETGEASDCEIDGERLSHDVAEAVASLNSEGFEVVSVTPVTSGSYRYEYNTDKSSFSNASWGWGYGYGYGFRVTEGVTIVAKRVNQY